MDSITNVAQECQLLFTKDADELARECGFVQRERKITGSCFVQALVFTWAHQPKATIADIVGNLQDNGIVLTEEAIRKRFSEKGAMLLRGMIEKALSRMIEGRREAIPLLRRFQGVYIDDCSTVTLPADLADSFPGCGGSDVNSGQAAVKMFTRIEVSSGAVTEVTLSAGRQNDINAGQAAGPMPRGALHLADLGFFDTGLFERYTKQGVWWISRAKAGLTIETATEPRQALSDFLQKQPTDRPIDRTVRLGQQQMSCRLVALPCPPAVAERRKSKLRKRMKKKGCKVSAQQLVMCEWSVFITNIPPEQLTIEELYVLYRLRWQIELLFKRWKSIGGLAFTHGRTGYRALCEFYAKLLGMIVANWSLLLTGGPIARHSPSRALRIVCEKSPELHRSLMEGSDLKIVFKRIVDRILALRPRKRRKKHPATRQLLFRPRVAA